MQSTAELHRKIKCRKETLLKTLRKLEQDKIIKQLTNDEIKEKYPTVNIKLKPKIYKIVDDDYEEPFVTIEKYQKLLKIHQDHADIIIKKIGQKSIFKNIKINSNLHLKGNALSGMNYTATKRQEDLDRLILELNTIMDNITTLIYIQNIAILKDKTKFENKLKQLQKESIETINYKLTKLIKNQKPKPRLALENYLRWRIRGKFKLMHYSKSAFQIN